MDIPNAQCAEGLRYFEQANPRCEEDTETYSGNGYYWWDAVWDEDLMGKALAALTAAAEKGYAPAQCALAECYRKLSDVLSEMMDHLMFFYDHSYSQSELIEENEELEDIENYWEKGFGWYEKAAEQGYPKALNALGDYYSGDDDTRAAAYYRASAEGGNEYAAEKLRTLGFSDWALDFVSLNSTETMTKIIQYLREHNDDVLAPPPATDEDIAKCRKALKKTGLTLPDDLASFFKICNGFFAWDDIEIYRIPWTGGDGCTLRDIVTMTKEGDSSYEYYSGIEDPCLYFGRSDDYVYTRNAETEQYEVRSLDCLNHLCAEYDSFAEFFVGEVGNRFLKDAPVKRPVISHTSKASAEDRYLRWKKLHTLVLENRNKPIAELVDRPDLPKLAAILAREENYEQLDRYFAEGLPINKHVHAEFAEHIPTPLHYITTNEVWDSMKDPAKMLKYLVTYGADPNRESLFDQHSPLEDQCRTGGNTKIVKSLLEAGADPNYSVDSRFGSHKPLDVLFNTLDYNRDTGVYTLMPEQIAIAALLLEHSAAGDADSDIDRYLAKTLMYGKGSNADDLTELLLKKGATIDRAVEIIKKLTDYGSSDEKGPALYTLWRLYDSDELVPEDKEAALNYLTQAAKERFYKPAKIELQNYLDELQYEADEGRYHGEI